MKTGTLFYNESCDRMDICFSDGKYVPTRIEMGAEWYLVEMGVRGVDVLAGLKVRM